MTPIPAPAPDHFDLNPTDNAIMYSVLAGYASLIEWAHEVTQHLHVEESICSYEQLQSIKRSHSMHTALHAIGLAMCHPDHPGSIRPSEWEDTGDECKT